MDYANVIRKQTTIIIVSVIGMVSLIIGSSYALFFQVEKSSNQTIETGDLAIQLSNRNESSSILVDSEPKSDEEGMESTAFLFSVSNTGTLDLLYNLYVYNNPDVESSNLVDFKYLRYSVDNEEPKNLGENVTEGKAIVSENIFLESKAYELHSIRIWIDEESPRSIDGESISLNVFVYGENYEETGPNAPLLTENRIPVEVNQDGTYRVADVSGTWYNYEEQNWAKSVLVSSENYTFYKENVGMNIESSDILGVYSWIPRFAYKLDVNASVSSQEIIFQKEEEALLKGTQNGDWITPTIFKKEENRSGFWVNDDIESLTEEEKSAYNLFYYSIYGVKETIQTS